MKLTVQVTNQSNVKLTLYDAYEVKFETGENGFSTATFKINRKFSASWNDFGFQSQIKILPEYGEIAGIIAWHGYISSLENSVGEENNSTINITALGYWSSLLRTQVSGGWSGTPEDMLASLITSGYCENLKTDTSKLSVTGKSPLSNGYLTPTVGKDPLPVNKIIQGICDLGTNVTGNRVLPQVWENRILSTKIVSIIPLARYIIHSYNIDAISLKRNLTDVYTRMAARYILDGLLMEVILTDTTKQNALAANFEGTLVPYVNMLWYDDTGQSYNAGYIAPTDKANAIFNRAKEIKSDSPGSLIVSSDYVIFDTELGRDIPNWMVRASNYIQIPDIVNFFFTLSGNNAGNAAMTNQFYISRTNYNADTNKLELVPDNNLGLETISGSKVQFR